jgi:hypothetical protein
MASFPLHLPVSCEQRRYLQNTQKCNKQVCFSFFFHCFRICFSLQIIFLFVFPFFLFQVVGGGTKGLLANGFMSRLCSRWRPVRVLATTRACRLLGGVLGGCRLEE